MSAAPDAHGTAKAGPTTLARTLGPLMIWGLGVGYVISGEYFGWNLGLPLAGTYGMLAATLVATVLYATFVLGYAEVACMLPQAGGAFVYASRAFGPKLGFLAGLAQWIEFVFAPPAIALAIGTYLSLKFPGLDALYFAVGAYLVFTTLNIVGVSASAKFEFFVTILAVLELVVFCGVMAPSFTWAKFSANPLPHGWSGAVDALPFAIWFYLAIEGIANIAEEAKNPQRDLPRGFGFALLTLVVLAIATLILATGAAGWEAVVYDPPGSETMSDSPLPLAVKAAVGPDHILYDMLVVVGVLGLVASFHGILLAAGRATFELGRAGFAPAPLGRIHPATRTPAIALVFNALVGLLALSTRETGTIITISVFGALLMYALSMASLFKLRRSQPHLERPFRVPFYPYTPAVALLLSVLALLAMGRSNPMAAGLFLGLLALGSAYFYIFVPAALRDRRET